MQNHLRRLIGEYSYHTLHLYHMFITCPKHNRFSKRLVRCNDRKTNDAVKLSIVTFLLVEKIWKCHFFYIHYTIWSTCMCSLSGTMSGNNQTLVPHSLYSLHLLQCDPFWQTYDVTDRNWTGTEQGGAWLSFAVYALAPSTERFPSSSQKPSFSNESYKTIG